MTNNLDIYIHIVSITIILLFTLLYAVLLVVSPNIYTFVRLFAVIVVIVTIYIGLNRNTYLPFLGYTAIPPILFSQELVPQGANVSYVLNLPNIEDGTYIIYWGSLSTGENIIHPNPMHAYGNYSNTGITKVKGNKATLFFNCPDKYNVGTLFKKTIDRHIHYRLIPQNSPIMSQVYTTYVNC